MESPKLLSISSTQAEPSIFVVWCIQHYLAVAEKIRDVEKAQKLSLGVRPPHRSVGASTLAPGIKSL